MKKSLLADWLAPAHGGKLNDWPEDQLAVLDVEHSATPWVIEGARRHFKEVSLADFEPLGTKGRRFLHRETGREYLLDESQVLMNPDPTANGVEFFAVDGYRIMFFRPRDFDRVSKRVVLVHDVVMREVPNDIQTPPRHLRKLGSFRLVEPGGPIAKREARDRERSREIDHKLAHIRKREGEEVEEHFRREYAKSGIPEPDWLRRPPLALPPLS